jgi:DNA ligase-associated metallophosphoesterase
MTPLTRQAAVSADYLLRYDEQSFEHTSSRLLLCGKAFHADKTGALYWPAEETLAVADLHLGRGSYLTEEDVLMPPYDTTAAFDKLEEAIDRYDPRRVIALGESFCGEGGLDPHDFYWLQDLMEDRDWFWVMGPDSPPLPEGIGGVVSQHVTLAGIKFRHAPVEAPVGHEVAGCMQPVASICEFEHTQRGRCFVSNGMRLVLPSMGCYGTGNNVLSEAFDPLLGRNGLFVWVLNNGRVQQVASGQLLADAAQ